MSWSPTALHNTVLRGGFGVFNNSVGAFLTGPTTGFSQTTTLVASNDSYTIGKRAEQFVENRGKRFVFPVSLLSIPGRKFGRKGCNAFKQVFYSWTIR